MEDKENLEEYKARSDTSPRDKLSDTLDFYDENMPLSAVGHLMTDVRHNEDEAPSHDEDTTTRYTEENSEPLDYDYDDLMMYSASRSRARRRTSTTAKKSVEKRKSIFPKLPAFFSRLNAKLTEDGHEQEKPLPKVTPPVKPVHPHVMVPVTPAPVRHEAAHKGLHHKTTPPKEAPHKEAPHKEAPHKEIPHKTVHVKTTPVKAPVKQEPKAQEEKPHRKVLVPGEERYQQIHEGSATGEHREAGTLHHVHRRFSIIKVILLLFLVASLGLMSVLLVKLNDSDQKLKAANTKMEEYVNRKEYDKLKLDNEALGQRVVELESELAGLKKPGSANNTNVTAPKGATEKGSKPSSNANPGTYTVKANDNLWDISKKYLGDGSLFPQILKASGYDEKTSLRPGMVLTIPDKSKLN